LLLPFQLYLNRFQIEHDQGTTSPASYASHVVVSGQQGRKEVTISMNEPLEYQGYTVYQASYEDAQPRPVTSIFAINQDPGRFWKYLGSLFIVLGIVWLFVSKHLTRGRVHK
jgi:cytochrome c biogenesis protein ResB